MLISKLLKKTKTNTNTNKTRQSKTKQTKPNTKQNKKKTLYETFIRKNKAKTINKAKTKIKETKTNTNTNTTRQDKTRQDKTNKTKQKTKQKTVIWDIRSLSGGIPSNTKNLALRMPLGVLIVFQNSSKTLGNRMAITSFARTQVGQPKIIGVETDCFTKALFKNMICRNEN